jgi:hypothetical protein
MDVGDIVYCGWMTHEGKKIPHFGLVVNVNTRVGKETILVTYATSKHVVEDCRPFEISLTNDLDIKEAGLTKPTLFDLRNCQRINSGECIRVGNLRLSDKHVMMLFKKAAIASGLI